MKLYKPTPLSLKQHLVINEKWVQEQIATDPTILGLGDLVLKDKERIHPQAGRLDLLFQDRNTNRRYEIELQLGKTDETHIIRTIEYWDIERKRYPQYEHCAVIIAEDITSRFLNVISLFNGNIPIIALQMKAFETNEGIMLLFTKVLDEVQLGLVDEDEEVREVTDRNYWKARGSTETMSMVDKSLDIIHSFAPAVELKYNKFYIGLAVDSIPCNFVVFKPRKKDLNFELKFGIKEEVQAMIDSNGLDDMGYDSRWKVYRIRISSSEFESKKEILKMLFQASYDEYNS